MTSRSTDFRAPLLIEYSRNLSLSGLPATSARTQMLPL